MKVESYVSYERLKAWFLRRTPASGVRRLPTMLGAIASDIGTARQENQDRAAVIRTKDLSGVSYTLIAVSDGMGGMESGGVCAATTLASFFTSFVLRSRVVERFDECMVEAALDANEAVHDQFKGRGGATLSSLLIRDDGVCIWLNVGDSRIYGVTGSDLYQHTTDDTIAGQLGNKFDGLKSRSDLLQFIGMGEELEPHCSPLNLDGYGHFLITTDGVHYLDKQIMGNIAVNSPDPGSCLKRLIDVSKWFGGTDNCTAVVFPRSGGAFDEGSSVNHGVCEIWDSFGDLQVYIDDKLYPERASKFEAGGQDEGVSDVKGRIRSKLKEKKESPKNKAYFPLSVSLNDKDLSFILESDSRTLAKVSKKSKEKSPPQLRISFPRKD